jgi:uncharacterized alkaline shock family protein YloU
MTILARTEQGAIEISEAALSQLVLRAAGQVEGGRVRRPRRGLHVDVADGRATVSLELAARRGALLPDLAREIQERVAGALERMCEVEVAAVDVSIEEIEG